MASGAQDFHITVPAGGTRNISRQGEFVYLKAADRAVDVIMPNQTRVTMEAGDKLKQDVFDGFQVQNSDPLNPAALVFTVGMGDYWRQIVQGEISVVPGLRGADGQWRPDTRQTIEVDLFPRISTAQDFAAGTAIKVSPYESWVMLQEGPPGTLLSVDNHMSKSTNVQILSEADLSLVQEFTPHVFSAQGVGSDTIWSPIHGYMMITNGGAYDLLTGAKLPVAINPGGFATATRIYDLANPYAPGRIVVVDGHDTGTQTNWIIDEKTLEVIETNPAGLPGGHNQCRIRWDAVSQLLVFVDVTWGQRYFDSKFNEVTGIQRTALNMGGGYRGFVIKGRYAYVAPGPGNYYDRNPIRKVVAEHFTVPAEVNTIVRQGSVAAQILGRQPDQHIYTHAAIKATGNGGAVSLAGEVVRFALENYFQRSVNDGYLDHVYGLEFSNDAYGAPWSPVYAGVETLDRANIADNFTLYLPTRMKITIDDALPLGDGSQVH